MAVVGKIGGKVCLQRHDSSNLFNFHNPNASAFSLMVPNPQSSTKPRTSSTKIFASSSLSSKVSLQPLRRQEMKKKQKELLHEKIDEWMRDSVVEIVKKLPESPLLVHVYSDDNNKTTKTKTEKAEENKWVSLKQKWEKGETPTPDGVIFVEQIREEEEEIEKEKNGEVSRAWGIVVQGKGEQGCGLAPACYLLKTSKVGSGFGLRCTHFCLVKVQSFRETAFSQLKNCWLLQGN